MQKPLKKNDIVRLEITGITNEGNGVGRTENGGGIVVFVPFTAIGDIADVKIVKVMKSFCYGIIDKIITGSEDRIQSDCEAFFKCGGCAFRHISYEAELKIKQDFVSDCFKRIGGLTPDFEEILGAENIDYYRNKSQYPVALHDGKAVCGFYSRRSHRVVPFTACKLQPVIFQRIADDILACVNKLCIPPYDEETQTGLLRHIYLRRGYNSGEIMVCLVVTDFNDSRLCEIAANLSVKYPEIKSIVLNKNDKNTNVILGKECRTIFGEDTIFDTMCGNKIELSPMSFYQVNTKQAQRLYDVAKNYADLNGGILIDLYCGAGTIGLSMADRCGKLIGVEIIPEAVKNAKKNALMNNIKNAEFICGDSGLIAQEHAQRGEKPDVIIIDPPRSGCDEKTIEAIVKMSPDRIVMISCNPATAARDAKILCEQNYHIKKAKAVDLFPRTTHVETIVLLQRGTL